MEKRQRTKGSTKGSSNSHRLLFYATIPVDKHTVKKNSKTIRRRNTSLGVRRFIGSTDAQKQAENFLVSQLWRRAADFCVDTPIRDRVWCVFNFQYSERMYYTKKGVVKKTLPDLSNLYELPQDALQRARIIENDSLIKAHDYSRITVGTETLLEIFIFPYHHEKDNADEFFRRHRIVNKRP